MQIDDLITQVQDHVTAAAALGDERTRQVAETLATAITPAVRLAIMGALSAAADEITSALLDTPGAPIVSLHLDGGDVRVDVRTTEPPPAVTAADDGDTSARISLRLSESLKADVEDAARRDGVSVNTWLIRSATSALTAAAARARGGWGDARPNTLNAHRVTGWING